MRVPQDVRDIIGKSHLSRSLRTDSLTVANRLGAQCALEAAALFADARGGTVSASLLVVPMSVQKSAGIGFEELRSLYLDDSTASRTAKTQHAYRSTLSVLIELIGSSTAASGIDRAMCRDVMMVLGKLPRGARKRWSDVSLREIARNADHSGYVPMSAANVNEYMNKLSTVLDWAIREEHCVANPAKGLRLPKVESAKKRRHAFGIEQLTAIFNAPLYRGCKDDERGYSVAGNQKPRQSRFWVPLLSLFCGLRLDEACQLLLADIEKRNDILCTVIDGDDEEKSLKTAASRRRIGFERFWNEARATGGVWLFNEIQQGCYGMHSGRFSR